MAKALPQNVCPPFSRMLNTVVVFNIPCDPPQTSPPAKAHPRKGDLKKKSSTTIVFSILESREDRRFAADIKKYPFRGWFLAILGGCAIPKRHSDTGIVFSILENGGRGTFDPVLYLYLKNERQCLAAKFVPKLVTDRPKEERPATQHDDSSASHSALDASTSSETFSETDITSNSDDDISLSEEVDAQRLEQEMERETTEVDNFILGVMCRSAVCTGEREGTFYCANSWRRRSVVQRAGVEAAGVLEYKAIGYKVLKFEN
ncbi:hypothetical protein NQ318_018101 [Aromia moschata]|uniref:Uncharacterized protein n=1 Tax=Aromia moschata TaxID=1265417 RepID=A0AAV8ZEP5_9CUCU|nr:hypothetical protein NQ318_018101 [Aromia moschata]